MVFVNHFGFLIKWLKKENVLLSTTMISSLKQPTFSIHGQDFLDPRRKFLAQNSPVFPSLPARKTGRSSFHSLSKPLHILKVESFSIDSNKDRSLKTGKAYEADRREPIIESQAAPTEAARRLKIGIYFATCWVSHNADFLGFEDCGSTKD